MRKIILGLAACGALVIFMYSDTNARDAKLHQFITAVDCNHTTVETGNGVVNNINCPYFPPTIENIVVRRSSLTATGIYDAVHMTRLRVAFRGVWYEYGIDAALTTNGNVWSIQLVGDDINIEPGDYAVVVQSIDENGAVQQDTGTIVVPVAPSPVNSGGDKEPTVPGRPGVLVPGVPNTGAAGFGISALALVIFVLPLLVRWHKKNTS